MQRTTDMTKGSPWKLLITFSLPLIVTNLGQQFYMIADAAIVGRGIGVKALAAVGSADWIYWLILWTVAGLAQGFSIFVSRHFGDKNYDSMNKTIAMSAVLCFVLGCIFTIVGIVSARPLLEALKTPSDIINDAYVYLITMISGTLVVTTYNMASSILRALGDGKTPLIAMIIAALLNIFMDLLFVMVFKWGIFGAAFASVLAQLLSFVYCIYRIKKVDCIKITKNTRKLDFTLIKELIIFGIPLATQYIVIALGGIILQSTINLQGSNFVAGYTAVNKLYGLLESTAISLGTAFSTYFAQNYGAGLKERIKQGISTGIKLCIIASLVIMVIILSSGKYLLQLFLDVSKDGGTAALEIGWRYLYIMALFLIILYLIYVYRNLLQAVGTSVWSMISGILEFIIRVVMGKVIILYLGIDTLFFIEPMAWIGALVGVIIPYFFLKNKYIS